MSVYIIAEAGVNHNGSMDMAFELIRTAHECGADAVKFQTFKTEKLVTSNAKKALYQNENDSSSTTQSEMLKQLELTDVQFIELSEECKRIGIGFLTTCFDSGSLEVICRETELKQLKIGSGDITNLPLIIEHARTGLDIIISTGMSTMSEVEDALAAIAFGHLTKSGNPESYDWLKLNYFSEDKIARIRDKVTILHCVTDYPASHEDLNLNAIQIMQQAYGINTGYSDHTLGIEACCAAVVLGATCLEKHLTLDPALPGPDHKASASPEDFKTLVTAVRNIEKSMAPRVKAPTVRERANLEVARKYLVAASDIVEGECFTDKNIDIKRSKMGISPQQYWDVIGKSASRNFSQGESISL
jgi:N-acetylneuraminate synthase